MIQRCLQVVSLEQEAERAAEAEHLAMAAIRAKAEEAQVRCRVKAVGR